MTEELMTDITPEEAARLRDKYPSLHSMRGFYIVTGTLALAVVTWIVAIVVAGA